MIERWMPKNLEIYWSVIDTTPMQFAWQGNPLEITRWEAGNVFETHDQALIASINIKSLLLSLHEEQPVTDCNQLPKLTAEVFDRPDCPEWAKYAAVDEDGMVVLFEHRPTIAPNGKWWDRKEKYCIWDGEYDCSDWQNSLVERPAKLPDWCKVGEWVYYRGYRKIIEVKALRLVLESAHCGNLTVYPEEIGKEVKPARLRPYNAEEMKALVGKVTKDTQGNISFITGYCARKEVVYSGTTNFTAECLLISCCFLDNTPCGVLEHLQDGEWVE